MFIVIKIARLTNVSLNIKDPRMVQHLGNTDALSRVQDDHLLDQVFDIVGDCVDWEFEFAFQDQFVKV